MNKITLVVTSWNPDEALLNKMLQSAKGFDEIVLHIDADTKKFPHVDITKLHCPLRLETFPDHLDVGQAYNLLINRTSTEYVCCFCDDDFFNTDELLKAIEFLNNTDADVVHFKINVFGECQPHVWGIDHVFKDELNRANVIPAGSFFKKTAWEKAGGFMGEIFHDWVLWLRILKSGGIFKYFDGCVYSFQLRSGSAAARQFNEIKGTPRENVMRWVNA